jgi:hypothetical protein
VTREQAIVLGFIAAAFVAGWVARAVIGWREQRRAVARASADQMELVDRFEGAIANNRQGFDRALRTYHEMVTSWLVQTSSTEPATEPLEAEVRDALQDDAVNETMLEGLGPGASDLTERELDLTDWGFTYGVAWARARARSGEDGESIAQEALRAAETVFDAYTAGANWAREPAAGSDRNGGPRFEPVRGPGIVRR